jgi:manganese transport protein
MALLQSLSADLDCYNVTWRKPLETYSPFINYILYFLAEIVAALRSCRGFGMAIGINLLFDIPLIEGV